MPGEPFEHADTDEERPSFRPVRTQCLPSLEATGQIDLAEYCSCVLYKCHTRFVDLRSRRIIRICHCRRTGFHTGPSSWYSSSDSIHSNAPAIQLTKVHKLQEDAFLTTLTKISNNDYISTLDIKLQFRRPKGPTSYKTGSYNRQRLLLSYQAKCT